ncbi:MAG TPA: cytochrome c [Pyrinomonadaceae bacterium]|jgi:mono/diheme cytochrome c family protein
MKLCKLALVACAALLSVAACSTSSTTTPPATNAPAAANTPAPTATPDELADARKTYAATCSRCHGDTGAGGEFDFDGKKMKAPSLREGHAVKHDDAHLAGKIADGGDGMPSFKKRLAPEQIDHIVRFIRRDFQAGATAAGNTNAARPAATAH